VGVAGSNPVVRSRSEGISAGPAHGPGHALGHRLGDGVDDEDDPAEGGKNDPGEPEHENVPKQRHGPNFEPEHRKESEEPPVRREPGDSDKGSGESKNDSSSSDDSSSSEGSG
jgi:hypothetical protein